MKNTVKIKIKKLNDNASMPMKAHPDDACYDLKCTSVEFDKEHACWIYGTGLAMEIPKGYCVKIYSRSSVYKQDLLQANCVGIIDANYRGEIKVIFRPNLKLYIGCDEELCNHNDFVQYEIGDRVAQMMVEKLIDTELEEVEELGESDRGEGGFGSTGK